MSIAIALAIAASPPDPLAAWVQCTWTYAEPRLAQPVESLVNQALAACRSKEAAVRANYIREKGPNEGAAVFDGVRHGIREIMVRRFTEAKRLRGL